MKTVLKKDRRSDRRRHRRMARVRLMLIGLCAVLCVCGVLGLVRYFLQTRDTKLTNESITEIYNEAEANEAEDSALIQTPSNPEIQTGVGYQFIGESILPAAQKLLEKNRDTVAWAEIPGVFSLPVVYRDNEYYLTHDFYGKKSFSGTLFLDVNHPLHAENQYLFIHGHNMHDGSMLGHLVKYRDRSFMENHPVLNFDTLFCREQYRVVAVLEVTEKEMYTLMRLGTPTFVNAAEFTAFANQVKQNALHLSGEEMQPSDAILALATCWQDERVVVLFRRVPI